MQHTTALSESTASYPCSHLSLSLHGQLLALARILTHTGCYTLTTGRHHCAAADGVSLVGYVWPLRAMSMTWSNRATCTCLSQHAAGCESQHQLSVTLRHQLATGQHVCSSLCQAASVTGSPFALSCKLASSL